MKISELLAENTIPPKKSDLPSAPSIDDKPEELELDSEIDDVEDSDAEDSDKQEAAIQAFKDAGKDLGNGLWAVALYPGSNYGGKEEAIGNLVEAFPEFKDNVIKSTHEQLFVAVFNEDSVEFESIRATPHEDDRKSSEQFNNLSKLQNRVIGDLYRTISRWSREPDKHNTHKLKSLLG